MLNLNVDYKRDEETLVADKHKPNREVSVGYIKFAVFSANPEGLEGQTRRIYRRLESKLDQIVESKSDSVELEVAEIDLLKKSFSQARVSASIVKYFSILEDEVEALKN